MQFHVGMRSSFFFRARRRRARGAVRCGAVRCTASRRGAAHCSLLHETVLSGKAMPTYANDALYARRLRRDALNEHRESNTTPCEKPIIGFLLHYLNTPPSSLSLSFSVFLLFIARYNEKMLSL